MINRFLNKIVKKDKLNILTLFAHERYDYLLCKTGHNFYSLKNEEGCRNTWNESRSIKPENYRFINRSALSYIDFDLVLSGNPFAHLPILVPIAKTFGLPIINIMHTCAPQGWHPKNFNHPMFNEAKHVFITETNSIEWTGDIKKVIHHAVETDVFLPKEKQNYSLTVCNDFINRAECGFGLWDHITRNTNRKVIGDTPGLSVGAKNIEELIDEFGKAAIYVNTSIRSPIPMALTESASAECGIVTTSTCSIPDFFRHEESALIFSPSRPEDGKEYIQELIKNDELRNSLGKAARKRMQEFTIEKFIANWNEVFYGS